jgi:hypothetical protein
MNKLWSRLEWEAFNLQGEYVSTVVKCVKDVKWMKCVKIIHI